MKRNLSAHRNPIRGVSRRRFGIELLLRQRCPKENDRSHIRAPIVPAAPSDWNNTVGPGRLDKNLYSFVDEVDGTTRFTLVRLEGKTVTAFVVFAQDGAI